MKPCVGHNATASLCSSYVNNGESVCRRIGASCTRATSGVTLSGTSNCWSVRIGWHSIEAGVCTLLTQHVGDCMLLDLGRQHMHVELGCYPLN